MSKDIEDRLRDALASRAEQVTAESLRPADAPQVVRTRRRWGTADGSRWTAWRTPVLVAAAAATVMVGLELLHLRPDDDPPAPANTSAVVTGSPCDREAELARAALEGDAVSADVDGDGALDRVATAVDGEAGPKCRAF